MQYNDIYPYITPAIAATSAYALSFHGLRRKSALQLERKMPNVSYFQSVKTGARIGAISGSNIGMQIVMQKEIEKRLPDKGTLKAKVISSGLVGILSSPVLAITNGKTTGKTILESLRGFRFPQAAAISIQEGSFVFGVIAVDHFKKYLPENKAAVYGAAYISGFSGSVIGHPANTALTRWQNGLKMGVRHSFRGGLVKAHWIGLFSLIYRFSKNTLDNN